VNKYICKCLVGAEEQSRGSVMEVGNGKLGTFAFIYKKLFFIVVGPDATLGPYWSSAAELLYFCNGKYNLPFLPKYFYTHIFAYSAS